MTFKEDCPDLRNTKVLDLFNQLSYHKCKIFLNDPIADEREVKNIFNQNTTNIININNLDVLILAVSHKKYLNLSPKKIAALLCDNGILIDLNLF